MGLPRGPLVVLCLFAAGVWPANAGADSFRVRYGPQRTLPALPVPAIGAQGVAVDPRGDVFALDGTRVLELPAGTTGLGGERVLPFGSPSSIAGLAADARGDVFAATAKGVLELPAGATTPRTLPVSGANAPTAVAVDASGDVFVANGDASHPAFELPAGASSAQPLPFMASSPASGIAVDSHGDVFLAAGDVLELPAGGGPQRTLPFNNFDANTLRSVAVGPHDEVYAVYRAVGSASSYVLVLPPGAPDGAAQSVAYSGDSASAVAATPAGLLVADTVGEAVFFLAPGASSGAPLPFTGTGTAALRGLGVDGAGDVFELAGFTLDGQPVARVAELPAGATSATQARLLPIQSFAYSLATNAAGDVFVGGEPAYNGFPQIVELRHGAQAQTLLPATSDFGFPLLAADGAGDVFWTEVRQGPFANLGFVMELPAGGSETSIRTLPFAVHDLSGLAASTRGDVVASSFGNATVVRRGAHRAVPVAFSAPVGLLAVDARGGAYGIPSRFRGDVLALHDRACPATEQRIAFAGLHSPNAIAVDGRGDVLVADAASGQVSVRPAVRARHVDCPVRITQFALAAKFRQPPALRFTVRARRAIRELTVTLPAGSLRFAARHRLLRALHLSAGHVRVRPTTLTISGFAGQVRRLTVRIAPGGLRYKLAGMFPFLRASATHITVRLADGASYTLRLASPGPP